MGATTGRTRTRKPQQPHSNASVRAVRYVRISDDPEGTEKGVDRQEADCRAYAEALSAHTLIPTTPYVYRTCW